MDSFLFISLLPAEPGTLSTNYDSLQSSPTQTQQLMLIELRFRQKRSSVAEYLLLHQNRDLDEESVASSAEGREIQIKESNEFLARNNLYY